MGGGIDLVTVAIAVVVGGVATWYVQRRYHAKITAALQADLAKAQAVAGAASSVVDAVKAVAK